MYVCVHLCVCACMCVNVCVTDKNFCSSLLNHTTTLTEFTIICSEWVIKNKIFHFSKHLSIVSDLNRILITLKSNYL